MKKFLEKILILFAKQIIKKYKPEIVGITGSVGKTSVKEAVFAVLSFEYNVRRNIKSYNNELGVPLTVIGSETGGRNLFKWLKVFYRAIKLLIFNDKEYPEILVLELGADKKGDIEYLLKIIKPKIGVLTAVSEAHLHAFKDLKGVLKEKEKIVTTLEKESVAVLNYDDENVMSLRDRLKTKFLTFGFQVGADITAGELLFSGLEQDFCESQYQWECKVWGTSFKINYNGSTVPVFLPHCFGKQQAYAALAAFAVGIAYKMNLVDISEALRQYRPPKGRMNLIAGIKYTLLIDDTYNSSPLAVKTALEVMKMIDLPEGKRKIAVLGDMLELGDRSAAAHREIGFNISEAEIDYLITVGNESKLTAESAIEAGLAKDNVHEFKDTERAGKFLQDIIQPGDLILIKGSQGIRMEKIVKEVMAEPEKAKQLLVRQTGEWDNR